MMRIETLKVGGHLWIVLRTAQGAKSWAKKLETQFGNCGTVAIEKGLSSTRLREVKAMKVEYTLTFQEYREAQAMVVRSRPHLYVFLTFVALWAAYLCNLWRPQQGSFTNWLAFFCVLAVVCGYLALVFYISGKKSWQEHLRLGLSTTLELTSDEIVIEKSLLTVRAQRDFYKKATESRNCFVLYLFPRPPSVLQIIPKRAFANAAELEQFRAWASSIGQKEAPPTAPIPQP